MQKALEKPVAAVSRIHVRDYASRALALALLIAVAAAFWWFRYGRGPEVTAVEPARGTAVEIVYATGAVEPVRWAKVASVVRDRIIEICDCEGRQVKAGDVLARLNDKEQKAALQELRAREDFAKKELDRQTRLSEKGVATQQNFERTSMELRSIQALILQQMEKLEDRTIAAPIEGTVLRRDGEVGEIAEAGQILFRIGAEKPLRVVAEVNEEDVPRVAVGQRVLLRTDAFKDQDLEGLVNEITPMGDPVAKTFRIKIALPDDTPLKPGISVEANVVAREKPNALVIPADAVSGSKVFVLSGDRVRERTITTGLRGTRAIEVLSGLAETEQVASVSAATALKDGQRVRITARGKATP